MVMAKIDRPILKPFPKPLPKPPEGHTDCFPGKPDLGGLGDKLADLKEFSKKDADKSGTLSREEFDAGRSKLEQLVDPNKFDRYDGNGDGAIDGKEYHAAREKERFKESIRGKLDLPGWEPKKLGNAVEAGAKHVAEAAQDAVDTVKNAVDDIF